MRVVRAVPENNSQGGVDGNGFFVCRVGGVLELSVRRVEEEMNGRFPGVS